VPYTTQWDTAVVLTGATDEAVDKLMDSGGFNRELSLPVLVNGYKARVLLARKS
jgi:hypothetical protein